MLNKKKNCLFKRVMFVRSADQCLKHRGIDDIYLLELFKVSYYNLS